MAEFVLSFRPTIGQYDGHDPSAVTQDYPNQTWEYLLDREEMDFDGLSALYDGEMRYLDEQLEGMLERLEKNGRFVESGRQNYVTSIRKELVHMYVFVRLPSGGRGGDVVEHIASFRQLFPCLNNWTGFSASSSDEIMEPLSPNNGPKGTIGGAFCECVGIQYIDTLEKVYDRFDIHETALARPDQYRVTMGDGANAFRSENGVDAELTEGTTDRSPEFANQHAIDDATKNPLEAMVYAG